MKRRTGMMGTVYVGMMALAVLMGHAGSIPVDLPRPDEKPPAKNKPVKVYILSGQSNMVGFGKLKGASPVYPSIYLSADPSAIPCKMPVGPSALLPCRIYPESTGETLGAKAALYSGTFDPQADYSKLTPVQETAVALGKVTEKLPALEAPHTLVVKAFIEVPLSGAHEVHAGFGTSECSIVQLDNKEVYRKEAQKPAVLTKMNLEAGKRYPLTITYLKGGSAAFWMELVDLQGRGDLETLVKKENKYGWLVDEKGEWTVRNDVILNESYLDDNKFKGGRSTPLSATANGAFIGPELGFGSVVGTFHEEPVLLIKADIGNRSLAWDCLPPGSERYEAVEKDPKTGAEKSYIYAGYKDPQDKWEKGTEPKASGWYAGKQYDEYTAAIRGTLDNFATLYPQFKDQGYEVAGFVWWQGHKDQNPVHASRYEQNLANLIKAWRKEFKAPEAKWVIATIAFGGWSLAEPGKTIAEAQLAVDGDTGKHPEFKGNVKTIEARHFWRDLADSPTSTGYHYNHNAETYLLTGDALGRAMVSLLGGQAETRPLPPKPAPLTKKAGDPMTLAEAARLVYSDAFISPYTNDETEPTVEQMASLKDALSPIIIGKVIPAYVAEAPGVPRYRRHGMAMMPIIKGERPPSTEWSQELRSQWDELNAYYSSVGMDDYQWKRFGPDMQNMTWSYLSFDPLEQQDKAKSNRYRKITPPQGMENWFAVDFDAHKAGWKTGVAPFGQKDGKLEPLSLTCSNPQCGCSIVPKTLWEKEVLLMRQSFTLPALKADHRYRLVVGGSAHNFSGEGYAVYVNGRLFTEATSGFAKSGSARGAYIYNDFLPEFQSGKVTIAVKSFLRHTSHVDKLAPPRGHLSLWLEAAKVPEVVLSTGK